MQPRRIILAMVLITFLLPFSTFTSAQEEESQCTPLIAEQLSDHRVIFSRADTGEQIREEALPYRFSIEPSPDCRFLIAKSVGYNDCSPGLIIWDGSSGETQVRLNGFCDTANGSYPRIMWSPDYKVAVIASWFRRYRYIDGASRRKLIWYPDTNTQIEFNTPLDDTEMLPSLRQVEWDGNLLWSSSFGGAVAYDLTTGAQVSAYPNPIDTRFYFNGTVSNFTFSPDRSKIIVHGQKTYTNATRPAMTVYDIATGNGIAVNVELNGAGAVAISPDNRYLAMSYTAVRVWDLWNLPENVEDRLPVYRLANPTGTYTIGPIQFTDNDTIEATPGGESVLWDLPPTS